MLVHVGLSGVLILSVLPEEPAEATREIVSVPVADEEVILQIEPGPMPADLAGAGELAGPSATDEAIESFTAPVMTGSIALEDVAEAAAEVFDGADGDVARSLDGGLNGVFGKQGPTGDEVDGFGVAFYGLKAFGSRFVFVADCSDSMAGERLETLKRELRTTVENLPASVQFSIVFFSHMPITRSGGRLQRASVTAKRAYLAWADSIGPSGGTDPSEAVQHALALKPTAVFLLTDGTFVPEPTLKAIRESGRLGTVRFYSIAVGREASTDVLKQIATMTGGGFRQVDEAERSAE